MRVARFWHFLVTYISDLQESQFSYSRTVLTVYITSSVYFTSSLSFQLSFFFSLCNLVLLKHLSHLVGKRKSTMTSLFMGNAIASSFVHYSAQNTTSNIETMGILFGKRTRDGRKVKCKKLSDKCKVLFSIFFCQC